MSTPNISRQLTLRADVIDATRRSVSACVATENPVDVFDIRTGSIIAEILVLDGVEVGANVPLLADHDRRVSASIGSVAGFSREGGELRAVLSFAQGTAAADEAWQLVSQKHLSGVSVGYRVEKYIDLRPGQSTTVTGRTFTAPSNRTLRITTAWKIREISLVPIPADEMSGIRSDTCHIYERTNKMSVINVIGRDISNMRWADFLAAGLSQRGKEIPQNNIDVARTALSQAAGVSDMLSVVNQSILAGFRSENDTTAGWVKTVNLPNFLPAAIAAVDVAPRLSKIAAGGVAPTVSFGVARQGWRLARFGANFVIDDQEMADGQRIGVFQVALEEVGRAARRVLPDLIFSMLLENAALSDGVAIFDATRGNAGTATLADTSLDTAVATVANQTLTDEEGDAVHQNLTPRYLTVPPALYGPAKRLARNMQTGEGDLIVRSESRIGDGGVLNPSTEEILVGGNVRWYLSCASDQVAGVVVGGLFGKLEPTIREYHLTGNGEYGIGFDVKLDIGVTVVGPKTLYSSTGAG